VAMASFASPTPPERFHSKAVDSFSGNEGTWLTAP
jgi:hypothetical protein